MVKQNPLYSRNGAGGTCDGEACENHHSGGVHHWFCGGTAGALIGVLYLAKVSICL